MKTISQRELRNENAAIMDGVENGETYTVTRRGIAVAQIVPTSGDGTGLKCVKPATKRFTPGSIPRVKATISTSAVLDDLKGER